MPDSIGNKEHLRIFVSYPHEDHLIASELEQAIEALPANSFEVFLDQTYIKGGSEIPPTIFNFLDDTTFFVGLGTTVARNNFSWCGYELGYFRAINRRSAGTGFTICLYHDEIPELFQNHRCYQIVSLCAEHRSELTNDVYEVSKAPLYEFFTQLANEHNVRFQARDAAEFFRRVEDWAESSTHRVTKAYFASLQNRVKERFYPQGRLEIKVPPSEFWTEASPEIPGESSVHLEASTYSILRLMMPFNDGAATVKSWNEFRQMVSERAGTPTITNLLRDIILSVLPNKADAQNNIVFLAPNSRYYRAILVMHLVYGNGRREFVFNLIETLQKNYGGDHRTTTLTAGIMLASKYRSIFLEQDARYSAAALSQVQDSDEFAVRVKQLMRDIDRINADAAADGLADVDALIRLLGETEEVKRLFAKWGPAVAALQKAAEDFYNDQRPEMREAFIAVHANFLEVSLRVNQRFITLCLRAYQMIIDQVQHDLT